MHFHTAYKGKTSKFPIDYSSEILSVGSCFSTHIASILHDYKFNILNNPYGTCYNPLSILASLSYNGNDFDGFCLQRDGKWVNYLSHSDVSSESEESLKKDLIKRSELVRKTIENASHLILTFGSAKVYELKSKGNQITANCHKQPSKEFKERYLSISEIKKAFDNTQNILSNLNSGLKIILTVSPVRYLADGMEMSQYGKAILRVACEEILHDYSNVEYFPSYEIMMDDLRDYRFYKEDMIHPNEQAIAYIWDIFRSNYIAGNAKTLIDRIHRINNNINHRPFNSDNPAYRKMLQKTLDEINSLPIELNFEKEKAFITKLLG
jgi:hypothetical protein